MNAPQDLSRRQTLLALGAALVSARGNAQPAVSRPGACILTAEQTEGPYFIDHRLNRSDLRSDPADGSLRDGVPLLLSLRVHAVSGSGCKALAGAIVHIWHCDADGLYSGISDPHTDTRGKQFLRGYQVSDADGTVRFRTIYPGWYPGRTVHIHFKVRTRDAAGKPYELTSQLYFDDALTDKVMAQAPYAKRGRRDRGNSGDGIYRRGGRELMLALAEQGTGYAAQFDIGVKLG
jgi:protocatechuate 3,4-dioxygenase beta subunit